MHRDITRRRVLIGGVVVLLRPQALIGDDMPAKITLTPSTAAPGSTIQVKGTGFGWKWWATITLDGVQVAKVQGSTSGNFTTSFVAAGTPGAHTVKAKTAYRSATATLTLTGITPPPDPPPDPPPAGRPWAAPVTTRTVQVPLNVDLNAFLATVPNGSIVSFPAGVYQMSKGLQIFGRNNLVLRGAGTTLRIAGPDDVNLTAFQLRYSDHITIDGAWTVQFPNYTAWPGQQGEASHVLSCAGWGGGAPSSYVEMTGVNALNAYGDFAYLEGRNLAPYEPSHHIWIHHNKGRKCGRNAVSPIDCTDVLIEDNDFSEIAYHAYDLEPNFVGQQIRRLVIRREKVGSYAHRSGLLGWFVSSWQPQPGNGPFAPISDITVTGNTVAGIAANGKDGRPRGLHTDFSTQQRATNVVFEDNTCTRPVPGPVLNFAYVNGLTVRRNAQPLISGNLTSFSNCSGVVTS